MKTCHQDPSVRILRYCKHQKQLLRAKNKCGITLSSHTLTEKLWHQPVDHRALTQTKSGAEPPTANTLQRGLIIIISHSNNVEQQTWILSDIFWTLSKSQWALFDKLPECVFTVSAGLSGVFFYILHDKLYKNLNPLWISLVRVSIDLICTYYRSDLY